MPPSSLFVEAYVTTLSVPRYCQEQPRGRSVAARRLYGTASRSHTTAPVLDRRALPLHQLSSLRDMKSPPPTFHRYETGHRLSPRATPPHWAVLPMQRSPCPMLHRFSAGATSPAPVQLEQATPPLAPASSHSSEPPDSQLPLLRTCPPDRVGRQPRVPVG